MKRNKTISTKKSIKKEVPRPADVVKATNIALERYAQTFKELARYDRGNKVSN